MPAKIQQDNVIVTHQVKMFSFLRALNKSSFKAILTFNAFKSVRGGRYNNVIMLFLMFFFLLANYHLHPVNENTEFKKIVFGREKFPMTKTVLVFKERHIVTHFYLRSTTLIKSRAQQFALSDMIKITW